MSVRVKISLSFIIMSVFMVVQSIIGLQQNHHSRELVNLAIHDTHAAIAGLNQVGLGLQQIRRFEKEYFIYIGDLAKRVRYADEWRQSLGEIRNGIKALNARQTAAFSQDDRARFAAWEQGVEFYAAEFERIVQHYAVTASARGDDAVAASMAANEAIQAGKARLSEVLKEVDGMGRSKAERSIAIAYQIENDFDQIEMSMILLTGGAILLSVIVVVVVYRSIIRSLGRLLAESERVFFGNLSVPVDALPTPEFGALSSLLEQLRVSRLAERQRSSQSRLM